jgi:hypothetical protein
VTDRDENVTEGTDPSNAEVALTIGSLIIRRLNGEDFSLLDEIRTIPPAVNHLMLAALLLIMTEQIERGFLTSRDFKPTGDQG